MNIYLKGRLTDAIEKVLSDAAEGPDRVRPHWDHWIHTNLTAQMSNAAEIVFDAAQDAQAFQKAQESD